MDSNIDDANRDKLPDHSADIARTVASLVQRGNVETLYTLAVAFESEMKDLSTLLNRAETALKYIADTLAGTPGEAYAESLIKLLPNRPFLYNHLRELVAMLVDGQRPDVIFGLFERYADSNEFIQSIGQYYHAELMSLLLQEAVVRRLRVENAPRVAALRERLKARQHPLAWLPLHLTELEDSLTVDLPSDEDDAIGLPAVEASGALPDAPPVLQPMLPLGLPPADAPLPDAHETTRSYVSERIRLAVAQWYNMETRTFSLERAVTPHAITARLLASLGLECLEGAQDADIRVTPTTPNRVLARLFAVAASGGPHEGVESAYGRLHAWASLGGLAGTVPDAPIETVCDEARRCTWFYFEAATDWFYQVGWDVGIVALRPDGTTLAVLAATATD